MMSKGLETLEMYKRGFVTKEYEIIEKELKAFEIIKEKRVDVELWRFTGNRDSYNRLVCEDRQLTEEEHEILKEVML